MGMERREYDVVLVPEAEGGYSVFVPNLPSVATQAETVEEALDMARDAIEGYLEIMREEGWPVPTVRWRARRHRSCVIFPALDARSWIGIQPRAVHPR